ncbi:MAG: sulfoxide reductase catalytic subunit YedY, partial [Lentimonas sp.]
MAYRWTNDLTKADITPKAAFLNRRQILAGTVGLGAIGLIGTSAQAAGEDL